MFVARQPTGVLRSLVDLIWCARGATTDAAFEWVLPSGQAQLLVNLDGDRLTWHRSTTDFSRLGAVALRGASTKPNLIRTSEQSFVCGASFSVGGLAAFVGGAGAELVDQMVDATELWSAAYCARLREALANGRSGVTEQARLLASFEKLLEERAMVCSAPAGLERALALVCNTGERLSNIANRVGRTRRGLSKDIRAATGLLPKRLQRVKRFRRSLRLIETASLEQSLTEVAYGAGYTDQAHFNHEFRELAAMTPATYRGRRTGYLGHVASVGDSGD